MYLRLTGHDVSANPFVVDKDEAIDHPSTDIDLELTGSGQTTQQLAATFDGALRMIQGEGQVDRAFRGFLMSDVLSQVFAAINPFGEEQTHTNLRCGVVDFGFVGGVATANAAVYQTDHVAIAGLGSIDFGTEALDLSFRTKLRQGLGISVTSVVNPYLKMGGTLGKPALKIDAKSGLVSGGVAFLTGGLSILAQGVWDRYLSADNMCEVVLADIESGAIDEASKQMD